MIHDISKGQVGVAALDSASLILFEPGTQVLRAKVEGVAEGLMVALENVAAGDKDLQVSKLAVSLPEFGGVYGMCTEYVAHMHATNTHVSRHRVQVRREFMEWRTRSKAVEQARGCVATKIGRFVILTAGSSASFKDVFCRSRFLTPGNRQIQIDWIWG